jgi:hypothetical protein
VVLHACLVAGHGIALRTLEARPSLLWLRLSQHSAFHLVLLVALRHILVKLIVIELSIHEPRY